MGAPVIDEIAEEYDGSVKVAKLDVDANQSTAIPFRRALDSEHSLLHERPARRHSRRGSSESTAR